MSLLSPMAGARVTERSPPGEVVLVCGVSSWWDLHGTPPQAPAEDPGHPGARDLPQRTKRAPPPLAQEVKAAIGLCLIGHT